MIALAVNLQLARDRLDDDPAAARELLDEMGRDVQRALDETARLAQRIYPPLLEAGGLGAALRAAALATGTKARIDVPAIYVPAEIAGAVYFCCLQLLQLAGQERSATIDVHVADGVLSLEASAATTGSELTMDTARDRVEGLGGVLAVRSAAEKVCLSASVPLAR